MSASIIKRTVLIAEDNLNQQNRLKGWYEKAGYEVVAMVEDGGDVLSEIEDSQPDLISLDVTMPWVDGVECAGLIKEKFPQQKIIFVSNLSLEPQFVSAYKELVGHNSFIAKSISEQEFLTFLESLFIGYDSLDASSEAGRAATADKVV